MTEILSQDEIEAILLSIASSEEEYSFAHFKLFDSNRMSRYTIEDFKILNKLFENYLERITSRFLKHTDTRFNFSLESIDELTFQEFIHSIPRDTCIVSFNPDPLPGKILIEIDPCVAEKIINAYCGGDNSKEAYRLTSLNQIEIGLLEPAILLTLDVSLRESFWKVLKFDLRNRLEFIQTDPTKIDPSNFKDNIILVTTELMNVGMINIAISHTTYHAYKRGVVNMQENKIDYSDVELTIDTSLGKSKLSLGKVESLEIGSIIELDKLSGEPIDIMINGIPKWKGEIIVVDDKYGVRLYDKY